MLIVEKSSKDFIYPVVFIAYVGLACITTWPLAARMTTHFPGESTDAMLHYWNGWWVQQALRTGQSPLYTHFLFYPNGVSLVTQNMAWFNILPWVLLEPLLGGIPAYNVVLLLNLVLCGCTAYCLTYSLVADARSAFLAGIIYLAWPFRLSQLDHPNLLATQWVPIFFLFFIRTIRKGYWRDSVLSGVCFALVGYTRWQQLIAATFMGLAYLTCTVSDWLPQSRRHILLRLVAAGSIACIALLPPALFLLKLQGDNNASVNLLRESEDTMMQTDTLAYLTPASSHPVLGHLAQSLYDRYYSDRSRGRRYPAYVGLVALCLAILGIKFRRKDSLPWLLMAVTLISLASGPLFRFNGQFYPKIPTLYRLLSPLAHLMRTPDRFNTFLALPVSVLAAYGVQGLLAHRRERTKWLLFLIYSLLDGLILFEYLIIPIPLKDVSFTPSFYAHLAREPGDFAVLNVPFRNAKDYMFDQTYHRRPILQGSVSRPPENASVYVDANPWLRFLRTTDEMSPSLTDVGGQLATLANDRIYYIIMHKTWIGPDRISHWQRYLLTEPRYEDEQVVIHSTIPEPGRDFALIEELAPGLGPIDISAPARCLNPGSAFEVGIGWGSSMPLGRDFDVALTLLDSMGRAQQTERFPLHSTWPTSQWQGGATAWEFYSLRLPPSTPPGGYTLTLTVEDAESGYPQGQPMPIQSITIQSEVCNLASVPDAQNVNAAFGDELRLLEYQVHLEDRCLDIVLYWYAQCRMNVDYKVFVHVFNPRIDTPVAQQDAMPRRWTYPTTLWWPGEVVDDNISIPLDTVPGGDYGIAIGVYEPTTGERLPLITGQGQLMPDGRLVLEEIIELD
jgi:hypothetical protein